ncbi:MAG: hypothetical protein ACK52X_06120, partial [bacterium]
MKKNNVLIFWFILVFLAAQSVFSQKIFRVNILCPDDNISKNLIVEYDNGKTTKTTRQKFVNGQLTITDTFYAFKAMITISRSDSNQRFSNSYFINELPATFAYRSIDSSRKKLVFENSNAIDLGDAGENELKKYTSKEELDVSEYFRKNGSKVAGNDSAAIAESNLKISAIINKRLEFVLLNN